MAEVSGNTYSGEEPKRLDTQLGARPFSDAALPTITELQNRLRAEESRHAETSEAATVLLLAAE